MSPVGFEPTISAGEQPQTYEITELITVIIMIITFMKELPYDARQLLGTTTTYKNMPFSASGMYAYIDRCCTRTQPRTFSLCFYHPWRGIKLLLPTLPPTSLLRQVPDPEATAPHPSVPPPPGYCGKVKVQTHQHVGNSCSVESRGFLKFLIHFYLIFPTLVSVRYSVSLLLLLLCFKPRCSLFHGRAVNGEVLGI